jgi:acyl-CoA dehydrogenase
VSDQLLGAARHVADVAAAHAAEVDKLARFPSEAMAAMRAVKLLSAPVPKDMGGGGCSMRTLGLLCSEVATGCGSSGMVLAMHYSQLACVVHHGMSSAFFGRYLQRLVAKQYLLASITSEVGTYGNTRSSICASELRDGGRFQLNKQATAGSYCEHADAILVTCRRAADAAANDQVLALLQRGDYELTTTTAWDTLGMRGTCSPGFSLRASAPSEQILPGSFADSAAQSMVPYSHILWSSVWHGIAIAAAACAGNFVRNEARKKPGTLPHSAVRLAELSADLQVMRRNWLSVADEFDALKCSSTGLDELLSMGWALKLNNLKICSSMAASRLVHQALQITGVSGYRNDSPYSVARCYRDVLSASVMISNDRILEQNANMLLIFRGEAPGV